jgi:hypothetical protein
MAEQDSIQRTVLPIPDQPFGAPATVAVISETKAMPMIMVAAARMRPLIWAGSASRLRTAHARRRPKTDRNPSTLAR